MGLTDMWTAHSHFHSVGMIKKIDPSCDPTIFTQLKLRLISFPRSCLRTNSRVQGARPPFEESYIWKSLPVLAHEGRSVQFDSNPEVKSLQGRRRWEPIHAEGGAWHGSSLFERQDGEGAQDKLVALGLHRVCCPPTGQPSGFQGESVW